MTTYEFEKAAKRAVCAVIKENHGEDFRIEDISVVWMAHVLGFKKCILIDGGDNRRMYEVTYNAEFDEMYVDEYDKMGNKRFDSRATWGFAGEG